MKKSSWPNLTLAIESAVCGGSISIVRDGVGLALWTGTDSRSKAEDLLPAIELLMEANDVSLAQLDAIAVSAGPGSFTGIRIGLATAFGLGSALARPVSSVSALKAMVAPLPADVEYTAALPVGRNAVCIQTLIQAGGIIGEVSHPRTVSEDDFSSMVLAETTTTFVVHRSLLKENSSLQGGSPRVIDFGVDLALSIGLFAGREDGPILTSPLFIAKGF